MIIKNEKIFKVKIYAFFQFCSFFSYLLICIALDLKIYNLIKLGYKIDEVDILARDFWRLYIGGTKTDIAIMASIVLWFGTLAFIGSLIIGFSIRFTNRRNLFDSLFLLFVLIPIISNVFALMAQISEKEIRFNKNIVNKKKIIANEIKKLEETNEIILQEYANATKQVSELKEAVKNKSILNSPKHSKKIMKKIIRNSKAINKKPTTKKK